MPALPARRSLTEGPIASSLLRFTIPLLLSSVAQQLYGTVDLFFAGNYLGANAAASLGVATLLISCLIGLLGGLATGANAVVAHLFGKKDNAKTLGALASCIFLSFSGGLVIALVCWVAAPAYLDLMATPAALFDDAVAYLQTCCISLVSVLTYSIASGAIRAMGDSSTPLIAQLIGGAANVFLDAFALCALGGGLRSLAICTLVSNSIAATLVILALLKHMRTFPKGQTETNGPSLGMIASIISIGLPVGLQTVAIALSNVVVQHQIDLLGVDAMAAFAVYFKIELPIYYAIVAIGQAALTFTAQNHGAGNHERMTKGVRTCQSIGILLTAALSVLLVVFAREAFALFVNDVRVIDLGTQIVYVTFPCYFIYAIMEIQGGFLRGIGKTVASMVVIIANICVLRVVLLALLTSTTDSVSLIAMIYPITWITASIGMIALGAHFRKKLEKNLAICFSPTD